MGYLNPIMQFGFENFCRKCVECGIDGVIIPDLPFRDYQEHYRIIAERYNIRVIMLITPETSEERVREIDTHTDGFIYMVSSAATTGAQQDFNEQKRAYFKKIEGMHLNNPLMVGFGISNKATFQAACEHASGAIIGSKFVTLLEEEKDPEKAITRLKEASDENFRRPQGYFRKPWGYFCKPWGGRTSPVGRAETSRELNKNKTWTEQDRGVG